VPVLSSHHADFAEAVMSRQALRALSTQYARSASAHVLPREIRQEHALLVGQ
jgi:hypothetical protein